jgi:hypothetical protein
MPLADAAPAPKLPLVVLPTRTRRSPPEPESRARRQTLRKSMKILDIPQSGKRGLTVSQNGRYGLISRAFVIPSNPQTAPQMQVRGNLAAIAAKWDTLTEAQRQAWIATAATQQTRSRLGQSGPMTGLQLYIKINATLALFGQEQVDAPPAPPVFDALAPISLVIANAGGVISLSLTCPGNPGENTVVRGAAPLKQGVTRTSNFRILGTCPAPADGKADITGLYTAHFGVPTVGTKVFVQCNMYKDGYQSIPQVFSAIVPQAA